MNVAINFLITGAAAALISGLITLGIKKFALYLGAVDVPDASRKIHLKPTPLLGGFAIYGSVMSVLLVLGMIGALAPESVQPGLLQGIAIGGAILMLGGFVDDLYKISWKWQILFPLLAILAVMRSGLEMPYVTNPFGSGFLQLSDYVWTFSDLPGLPPTALSAASVFLFLWLLGMTYTTKLLDGIDGLACSISLIAAVVIFVVSLFWDKTGSTTSYLSAALAGGIAGFLVWNWHPAKIFLGEGGSTFLGFMLGVLAVLSGGKIATALLVMGIPILDVVWILVRRLHRRQPLFRGDALHLHFRLLRAGLTQRQIVLLLSSVALAFGSVSFFFTTRVKVMALLALILCMAGLGVYLVKKYENTPHR